MNLGTTTITLVGEETEKFAQFVARIQRLFRWTSVQTLVENATGSLMIVIQQARENQGQIQVRDLVSAYDAFVVGLMQAATVRVIVNDDVTGMLQQQMQELATYSNLLSQIDGPYASMYRGVNGIVNENLQQVSSGQIGSEDLQQMLRNLAATICVVNTRVARDCGMTTINPVVGMNVGDHLGTQTCAFVALANAWDRFTEAYDLPVQSQVVSMGERLREIAKVERLGPLTLRQAIEIELEGVATHIVSMVPNVSQHSSQTFETNDRLGTAVREVTTQLRSVAEHYGLERLKAAAKTMEETLLQRQVSKRVLVAMWLQIASEMQMSIDAIAGTSTPTASQLKATSSIQRHG